MGKVPEYMAGLAILTAACNDRSNIFHLDLSNNSIPYNELQYM